MDAEQTGPDQPDQPPAEHPEGHEDEVLLDSPEQAAALLGEADGPDGAGAPWADGPDTIARAELPEPSPSGAGEADGDDEDELLPASVEGVGDLVADPLSRAKVVARDDPGGPAPEEVPPSPS